MTASGCFRFPDEYVLGHAILLSYMSDLLTLKFPCVTEKLVLVLQNFNCVPTSILKSELFCRLCSRKTIVAFFPSAFFVSLEAPVSVIILLCQVAFYILLCIETSKLSLPVMLSISFSVVHLKNHLYGLHKRSHKLTCGNGGENGANNSGQSDLINMAHSVAS